MHTLRRKFGPNTILNRRNLGYHVSAVGVADKAAAPLPTNDG